jgi:hypothetical protein
MIVRDDASGLHPSKLQQAAACKMRSCLYFYKAQLQSGPDTAKKWYSKHAGRFQHAECVLSLIVFPKAGLFRSLIRDRPFESSSFLNESQAAI